MLIFRRTCYGDKERGSNFKRDRPMVQEVDGVIAGVCAGAFAAFLIWSQVAGDSMGEIMSSALAFLTQKVGAIYLITAFVIIAFCLYLVFSKYGSIRLGADDEKPEYHSLPGSRCCLPRVTVQDSFTGE